MDEQNTARSPAPTAIPFDPSLAFGADAYQELTLAERLTKGVCRRRVCDARLAV